jgi:hypothetical protein
MTAAGPMAVNSPPQAHARNEITYRGYRIEPESYAVHTNAWAPRVVVSLGTAGSGPQRTPLYSPKTATYLTRDEADHHALDVARAWIDAAITRG